jgi:hypothetical protein
VAAGEIAEERANVTYFPAYEIVCGPQAPHDYFEPDRREVSAQGVEAVMDAMLARSESSRAEREPIAEQSANGGVAPSPEKTLSELVTEAECDDALAEF